MVCLPVASHSECPQKHGVEKRACERCTSGVWVTSREYRAALFMFDTVEVVCGFCALDDPEFRDQLGLDE